MKTRFRLVQFLFCIHVTALAWAGSPVSWTFTTKPAHGDTVNVLATASCEEGWHIYALVLPSDLGPLPTELRIPQDSDFTLVGAPTEPDPVEMDDPNFGVVVRFHPGTAIFQQALLRAGPAAFVVKGVVEYMACNDKTCLPPHAVPFTLDIPSAK